MTGSVAPIEGPITAFNVETDMMETRPAPLKVSYARPAFPYENPKGTIVNGHGRVITQADFDDLSNKYDRLLRLCQTHGLMVS